MLNRGSGIPIKKDNVSECPRSDGNAADWAFRHTLKGLYRNLGLDTALCIFKTVRHRPVFGIAAPAYFIDSFLRTSFGKAFLFTSMLVVLYRK